MNERNWYTANWIKKIYNDLETSNIPKKGEGDGRGLSSRSHPESPESGYQDQTYTARDYHECWKILEKGMVLNPRKKSKVRIMPSWRNPRTGISRQLRQSVHQ
jgi:hypothetical protein